MTNTKFRKRALLSSVAMLLVALVALGSATFAWFNTQNKATAKTITANTTKGSDITLSETGGSAASPWTHNLKFSVYTAGDTTALVPVTTSNFTDWNTVNAADYNVGYSSDDYTSVDVTNEAHIKHSYLYIKSTKGQDITITPVVQTGKADDTKFLRLVLKPLATSTSISGHGPVTEQKESKTIIWTNGGLNDRAKTGWTAANQTGNDPAFNDTSKYTVNNTMTADYTLTGVTADKINAFEVFVYAEGTDKECIDDNAGTTATITFNVTGSLQN